MEIFFESVGDRRTLIENKAIVLELHSNTHSSLGELSLGLWNASGLRFV